MDDAGPALTSPAVGFAPIEPPRAQVLILGSLPGVASIKLQQYYAHSRNAFWPIMGRLYDFDPREAYEARIRKLHLARIAVWDVCYSAVRAGSLDSSMLAGTMIPNDIAGFLNRQPGLTKLLFNGGSAATQFRRLIVPTLSATQRELPAITLPSTSPAHAARSFEWKLAVWRDAIIET